MKNIIIAIALFFCTTSVSGQLTDRHSRYSSRNDVISNEELIEDQAYLTFNFSLPVLENNTQYFDIGAGVEFGMDKYLGLQLPKIMKIGVDYGFSLNMMPNQLSSNSLFLMDTKVGIVYTYRITNDLTLDAKFTLKPTLANNGNISDFDFNLMAGFRTGIGVFANFNSWRVGFELSNGKLKYMDVFIENYQNNYGLKTGRLDISFGFKF